MTQRRQITYSGHVQGVGFRYTARSISQKYAVTGYVQNLPDGCVELVAEGAAKELDCFLDELSEQMSGRIRSAVCDQRPANGEFAAFEIRY